MLQAPHEQHLLRRLALRLGKLQQCGVLVERGVGAAEAGVGGAVDSLGGVVGYEGGGGVVGVEFYLVYGGGGFAGGV